MVICVFLIGCNILLLKLVSLVIIKMMICLNSNKRFNNNKIVSDSYTDKFLLSSKKWEKCVIVKIVMAKIMIDYNNEKLNNVFLLLLQYDFWIPFFLLHTFIKKTFGIALVIWCKWQIKKYSSFTKTIFTGS